MKKQKTFKELKKEVLKNTHLVQQLEKVDLRKVEYISKTKEGYISPIFTMSEDEILAFVECFEVEELAALSVAELNYLGEVLGVEPSILAQE